MWSFGVRTASLDLCEVVFEACSDKQYYPDLDGIYIIYYDYIYIMTFMLFPTCILMLRSMLDQKLDPYYHFAECLLI